MLFRSVPTAYRFKIGLVSGAYTATVSVATSQTTLPVMQVITSSGIYYCTVSAVNAVGESLNANEVRLVVGLAMTGLST